MSVRQFLDVVPESVKTVAAVIAEGGVLIGLAFIVRFIEGKAFIGGCLPSRFGGRCDRNLDSRPGLCQCRCPTASHAAHPLDAHRSVHP